MATNKVGAGPSTFSTALMTRSRVSSLLMAMASAEYTLGTLVISMAGLVYMAARVASSISKSVKIFLGLPRFLMGNALCMMWLILDILIIF